MKTTHKLLRYYILPIGFIIFYNCSNNNEPIYIPPANNGKISNLNITPSGNVTETDNGYLVDGSLTIETSASGDVVFDNADLEVQFDSNGTLISVTGTSNVPSMDNYFEFNDPVQADVGFFSGKFLNENRDFEIQLVDERYYFVFNISVDISLQLGANDDPEAQKPLTIHSPVGGHITLIIDFTDPMFFFSIGASTPDGENNNNNNGNGSNASNSSHTKLGGVSFGASYESNFKFIPTNPVSGNIISFNAGQVIGGTVTFFKVLETTGMFYQNVGFDVNANFNEPMESDFGADYRAGINGTMNLSLGINNFISFGFPIASGSAAMVAEASTNNSFIGKAFINGLVKPDLSWWPDIIPIAPSGNMNTYGFVEQTGNFDIGLSGAFNLETPTGTQSIGGALQATPEAFSMEGQVTIDDKVWTAKATFTKDETRVVANPPGNFTDGISETVSSQIDAAIETTEQAIANLEAANEKYELELSLRGIRATLPDIIDQANAEITTAVNSAVASGESQADAIASDNGAAICSTNISSVVNNAVQPYRDALNRLKNAVNDSNDNDQTRIELEAALRDLASLNKINKTVTVTITYGNKANLLFGKCNMWSSSTTRNITISRTIMNTEQVNLLLEAADNVQYIAEAEGLVFDAQIIIDKLPTIEELETLKSGVETCISELTDSLEASGYRYNHNTKEFTAFIIINGEEKSVKQFDVFSSEEFVERARVETSTCNPDGALQRLINDAKKRN